MAFFRWRVDPVKQLAQLAQGLRNKAMRMALNKAAAPIKQIVVSNAPKDSGALKQSMRIKLKQYKRGKWICVVGPKADYEKKRKGKMPKRPGRYNSLVNKGTKYMSGRHHMDNARRAAGKQFINDFRQALRQIIPTLMKK